MLLKRILLLFIIVFNFNHISSACSCTTIPSFKKAVLSAKTILSGIVVETTDIFFIQNDTSGVFYSTKDSSDSLIEKGRMLLYYYNCKVKVEKVYNGVVKVDFIYIQVPISGTACSFFFNKDGKYIIYSVGSVYYDANGLPSLYSDRCNRTMLWNKKEDRRLSRHFRIKH